MGKTIVLKGRPAYPGVAEGYAMCCPNSIQGWAGVEAKTGKIIEKGHVHEGESFDGKYAAIGEVVSGLELLQQISNIKNLPDYAPVYSLRTLTTTVDLKGVTYEKPITQERRTYPGLNLD